MVSRSFLFSSLIVFGLLELILIAGAAAAAIFFVGLPYLETVKQSQANQTEELIGKRVAGKRKPF